MSLVRASFGRELEYEDIYQHVTCPESVYLLEDKDNVLAMGSYHREVFSGIPSLIVEGIAVAPKFQGRRLFERITDEAREGEQIVCLRTQNPRMYRALQIYCNSVYPGKQGDMPDAIRAIRDAFASYAKCELDEKGVVKGYYGGLFYGEEPAHRQVSEFFKKGLEMKLNEGDAMLAVGVK